MLGTSGSKTWKNPNANLPADSSTIKHHPVMKGSTLDVDRRTGPHKGKG